MKVWDRYTEFLYYRVTTGSKRFKIVVASIGPVFWFGLMALFVFASLWVDGLLSYSSASSSWALIISVIILTLGVLLSVWSASAFYRTKGTPVPFNPPPRLVTTGLYTQIRNPMLTGMFLLLLGLGILFRSFSLILIFTPFFIFINVFYIKVIEEKELAKRFGEEYLEYKRNVPMFIPGLKRLRRK